MSFMEETVPRTEHYTVVDCQLWEHVRDDWRHCGWFSTNSHTGLHCCLCMEYMCCSVSASYHDEYHHYHYRIWYLRGGHSTFILRGIMPRNNCWLCCHTPIQVIHANPQPHASELPASTAHKTSSRSLGCNSTVSSSKYPIQTTLPSF